MEKSKMALLIIMILILILPLFFTGGMVIYFFGDLITPFIMIDKYREALTITPEGFPTYSEAIYYLICIYTMLTTGIFSYVIWKTGIKSNQLSEELKKREEDRDEKYIRENALIVYYDLITGFENIRQLFVSRIIDNNKPVPSRVFFSTDWIKNVAIIKDSINHSDIDLIYFLYNRLLTIKSLLEEEEIDLGKLDNQILDFVELVFTSNIPKARLNTNFANVEILLNRRYYTLLRKLQIATYRRVEVNIKHNGDNVTINNGEKPIFSGKMENYNICGKAKIYNSDGLVKYDGIFKDSVLIDGVAREYYKDGSVLYQVNYKNNEKVKGSMYTMNKEIVYEGDFREGTIINGITESYVNHKLRYKGSIINEERSGAGKLYNVNNKLIFEGFWNNNEKIEGKLYGTNKGIKLFEGWFMENRPWDGHIEYDSNYEKDYIRGFKGELKNGKPYSGKALKFFQDARGMDYHYYTEVEPYLEEQYDQYEEDYYDDQNEQMHEDIKTNYNDWSVYIKCTITEGNITEEEDVVSNKEIFYNKDSYIKQSNKKG
jgi:hypothetical protein